MRKTALILIIAMLVSCMPAGAFASDEPQMYVNDTYDDNITNDSPQNATAKGHGSIVRVVEENGSKMVVIRNIMKTTSVKYTNLAPKGNILWIQSRVKLCDKLSEKTVMQITTPKGNTFGLVKFMPNGYIINSDGKNVRSYSVNKWYDISVRINVSASIYDIYIDGKLAHYGMKLAGADGISQCLYASAATDGKESKMYVDEFRVYSSDKIISRNSFPEVVYNTKSKEVTNDEVSIEEEPAELFFSEDFEGTAIGVLPEGFEYKNPDGLSLVADPVKEGNKVIRLDNAGSGVSETFFQSAHRKNAPSVAVEFDIYAERLTSSCRFNILDGKTWLVQATLQSDGKFNIINGGTSKTSVLNKWAKATVIFNFEEKKVDLYINGKPEVMGAKMANSAVEEHVAYVRIQPITGGSEIFYIDNYKVYKAFKPTEFEEVKEEVYEAPLPEMAEGIMENVPKLNPDISKFAEVKNYVSAKPSAVPGYDGALELCKDTVCFVQDNCNVWLKDKRYSMPLKPYRENHILYAPAEYVAAAVGFDYSYDEVSGTVKIGDITVKRDETTLSANNKTLEMRGTVQVKDGHAYVPLKEIVSDAMGKYYFESVKGMTIIGEENLYVRDELAVSSDLYVADYVKMMNYIIYERPNAATIKQMYYSKNPELKRPYIYTTSEQLERLKEIARTDEIVKKWSDAVIASAAIEAAKTELPKQVFDPQTRFEGTPKLELILGLCWAYHMTGDVKYSKRAIDLVMTCAQWESWSAYTHYISVCQPTDICVAVMDFLYDELTEEQKDIICRAMYNLTIKPGLDVYYGRHQPNYPPHTRNNNWNSTSNASVVTAALAIMDRYQTDNCADAIEKAIQSLELVLHNFAPDGGWYESLGYWSATAMDTVQMIYALQNCVGSDFSLANTPGFLKTGYFPFYMQGNAGGFAYHDTSRNTSSYAPEVFWFANYTKDPGLAAMYRDSLEAKGISSNVKNILYYYQGDIGDRPELSLDKHFGLAEVASMRSDWSNSGSNVFVAMHAGYNSAIHGQFDMGTFEYSTQGVKFATDMGSDDYNLPGYWSRVGFYVHRAEGHNVYVLDPDETAGQYAHADSVLNLRQSKPKGAIYTVDMTSAYAKQGVTKATRGFMLSNSRKVFTVQDEFVSSKAHETHWLWHTPAHTYLGEDGKSVILSQGNKSVTLHFDCNVPFEIVLRKGLPFEKSPSNPAQLNNLTNAENLVDIVFTSNPEGTTFRCIAVPQDMEYIIPETVTPIDEWNIPDGEMDLRYDYLSDLRVGGATVEGFAPQTSEYSVLVESLDSIPTVDASTEGNIVVLEQATQSNGYTAVVKVASRYNEDNISSYSVVFKVNTSHTKPAGTEFVPMEVTVSAQPELANGASNLTDNSFDTRWAAMGSPYAVFDLGSKKLINAVAISIYLGNERKQNFAIDISEDGKSYTTVVTAVTSGTTTGYEYLGFAPVEARYVRLRCMGTNVEGSQWNSITEFRVIGQ